MARSRQPHRGQHTGSPKPSRGFSPTSLARASLALPPAFRETEGNLTTVGSVLGTPHVQWWMIMTAATLMPPGRILGLLPTSRLCWHQGASGAFHPGFFCTINKMAATELNLSVSPAVFAAVSKLVQLEGTRVVQVGGCESLCVSVPAPLPSLFFKMLRGGGCQQK